jgi:hypothetical protein
VGVQVHDAGHQGQALGIDAVAGRAVHLADVGDAALRNSHVGLSCGLACAVKNLRITDDQVMHLSKTLLL